MAANPATGATGADLRFLRDVTEAAAQIFTEPPRQAAATTYLRRRGIDASLLGPEWVVGYAPPGWTRLIDRLRSAFAEDDLIAAGVARRSGNGGLIDTFRARVMFGVRDIDGTIAGFIGRDLSGDPNAPKYLNTHRHTLFDKSKLLFGLYEAGAHHLHAAQPVIVEGPLDALAIAARQRAERSDTLIPIAASGTSFSAVHARGVAELALGLGSIPVVAMDADAAGRSAAIMAAERLRAAGTDVRIAILPAGADPAAYLARPDAPLDALRAEQGVELINLYVEDAIARRGDAMKWPEGRISALRNVANKLSTYPPDYVARRVSWLADALHVNASTVTLELAEALSRSDGRSAPSALTISI